MMSDKAAAAPGAQSAASRPARNAERSDAADAAAAPVARGAPAPARDAEQGETGPSSATPRVKTFSVVDQAEVRPPEAVRLAIENFDPPRGTHADGNNNSTRAQAFMYSWGVYVVPNEGEAVEPRFFCLANASCRAKRHAVACKGGHRGNVNKHLKTCHEICGAGSFASQVILGQAVETSAAGAEAPGKEFAGAGRPRALEMQFVRWLVKKLQPFDTAEDSDFLVLQSALAKGGRFPSLGAPRVKHIIVEMYKATKKVAVKGLKEEIDAAPLPILHFTMDVWTCKESGLKFLETRIFWMDRNLNCRDAVLSVKHYCPAVVAEDKASDMLWTIFKATIRDFGLDVKHFASCTTAGGGSSIQAMCTTHARAAGILWDWCVSHMASEVLEDAFSPSADPAKSKNKDAREMLMVVMGIVERASKYPSWRTKFKSENLQVEDLGVCLKNAKPASPHRWLTMVNTFLLIIQQWYCIRQLYMESGKDFPLDAKRDEFFELFSLLLPLATIVREAQSSATPMSGETHLALAKLKQTTLCSAASLKVYQIPAPPPSSAQAPAIFAADNANAKLKTVEVPATDLAPATIAARSALSAALTTRLYGRVWDTATAGPSFFRDASVVLTPPFVRAKHLDHLRLAEGDGDALPSGGSSEARVPTSNADVELRRAATWEAIRQRAARAGKEKKKERGETEAAFFSSSSLSSSSFSTLKRVKTTRDRANTLPSYFPGDSEWDIFGLTGLEDGQRGGDEDEDEGGEDSSAWEMRSAEEVARFQTIKMSVRELSPKNAARYWRGTARHAFPLLRAVAQQALGNQASAARAERCLSGAGRLLAARRSRLEAHYVEMMLFLHVHFDEIPRRVPAVEGSARELHLPTRFVRQSDGLKDAEAFVDPYGFGVGVPDGIPGDLEDLDGAAPGGARLLELEGRTVGGYSAADGRRSDSGGGRGRRGRSGHGLSLATMDIL